MAHDTSDPKAVEKSRERADFLRKQARADLATILASKEGRRWMFHHIQDCRVLESIWDSSSRFHYLAGRQDVGTGVLKAILDLDPKIYLSMLTEAKEERRDG